MTKQGRPYENYFTNLVMAADDGQVKADTVAMINPAFTHLMRKGTCGTSKTIGPDNLAVTSSI